jgi:hypothetical protein
LALAKGNPLESKTLIWKLLKATPELLPTEIALRYCQAELYQVIAPCALAGNEHTTNPPSNTAARKNPRLASLSTQNGLSNLRPRAALEHLKCHSSIDAPCYLIQSK